MADFTHVPQYPFNLESEGPTVLTVRLEDKKRIRRRKSAVTKRTGLMRFRGIDRATASAIKAFHKDKGTDESFTVAAYDPEEANDQVEYTVTFRDDVLDFKYNIVDGYDVDVAVLEV